MSINEKLNAIQVKLNAPKDKKNTFGGYSYRSAEGILQALKPLLKETGCTLTMSDAVETVGGRVYIMATAVLTDGAETVSTTAFAREPESKKGMDEAQVTGTASSYARKYALNGLFAIDDNKDTDTNEYAWQTDAEPKKKAPTNADLICKKCGKAISPVRGRSGVRTPEQVAAYTNGLCYDCHLAEKRLLERGGCL